MFETSGLASQDQLFAYYMHRCGCHRVSKPNASVLQLLEECVPSPVKTGASVPLASRHIFKLTSADGGPVHVGARGMLPLLELVAVLPLIEELDLSNLTSWYASDAFVHKSGVSGNDVVDALCRTITQLPRLRRLSMTGQPIGSQAAYRLYEALQKSPRLTSLAFDGSEVALHLRSQIAKLIESHAHTPLPDMTPTLPATVPDCVARLPCLDRKTLREQQLLRHVLDGDAHSFADILTEETMSDFVLSACTMSLSEVVARCPDGVRGDGHHLFILKSGAVRAYVDRTGLILRRGDFFGDTYADALFPRCDLSVEEEGVVFCVPLSVCEVLLTVWRQRVSAYVPVLRTAPFFQAVDLWSRVRTCTCASQINVLVGQIALRARDPSRQLFLVCSGTFLAMPGEEADRLVTGRCTPFEFVSGDVFGMEALVSHHACSSVPVVGGSAVSRTGEPQPNVCLHISGSAVRCLSQKVHSLLFALSRPFSVHDDLRRTAKWRTEHDPVAEYMYNI